jgi:hypothetical protein
MCIQTYSHQMALRVDGQATGPPEGRSAPVELTAVNPPEQGTADMSVPDEYAFELLQESA